MIEPTIYTEYGVRYAKVATPGYKAYQYTWEFTRNGVRHEGTRTVYCHNRQDFLTLLDFWNHSDYKYVSLLGQV